MTSRKAGTATQGDLFANCQRWRDRRASYRPAGEVFDTSRARVEVICEADAKAFVTRHHYSGTYPAARCRVGLFVKRAFQPERLAGVAVFSVPMTNAAIPAWFPDVPAEHGVELGRFVLLDEIEANAETWFQARALRTAAQELDGLQAVLSYCDPVARTDSTGRKVFPGHLGTIYRAGNATALGRSTPRTLRLLPNGRVASERALSKIRAEDRGAAYAIAQLVAAGAPPRKPHESGDNYLMRVDAAGIFRRMRHGGNLVFGWRVKPRGRSIANA